MGFSMGTPYTILPGHAILYVVGSEKSGCLGLLGRQLPARSIDLVNVSFAFYRVHLLSVEKYPP